MVENKFSNISKAHSHSTSQQSENRLDDGLCQKAKLKANYFLKQ